MPVVKLTGFVSVLGYVTLAILDSTRITARHGSGLTSTSVTSVVSCSVPPSVNKSPVVDGDRGIASEIEVTEMVEIIGVVEIDEVVEVIVYDVGEVNKMIIIIDDVEV